MRRASQPAEQPEKQLHLTQVPRRYLSVSTSGRLEPQGPCHSGVPLETFNRPLCVALRDMDRTVSPCAQSQGTHHALQNWHPQHLRNAVFLANVSAHSTPPSALTPSGLGKRNLLQPAWQPPHPQFSLPASCNPHPQGRSPNCHLTSVLRHLVC